MLGNTITGDKLTDDAGDNIRDEAVDIAQEFTEEYATQKKAEAIKASKDYVGDTHGFSTFEAYIKWWVDNH